MDSKTAFYILGGILVVSAVALALVGLRSPEFPKTRGILLGVIAYFVVLVAATTSFAVLQASNNPEERQHNAEAAAAARSAAANGGTTSTTSTTSGGATTSAGGTSTTSTTSTTAGGATTKLPLAADPSGQLAFDKTSLSAKAGNVEIDFTNQSPVGHDVCVDSSDGTQLGCTNVIQGSSAKLDLSGLQAGSYTFYCSVPGHEDAGMKGTLTVK
jgi:plastocyanin